MISPGASVPPRTVLFDVDGTLAETERDGHRIAFNLALAAAGIDAQWDARLYGDLLAVAGGKQRLQHFFETQKLGSIDRCRLLAEEIHAAKTKHFVEIVRAGEIAPRPGVRPLVHDLQRQGVPTGVVTTGRRAWVEPLVSHLLGPSAYAHMAVVVAGDDVAELKPSPEAYLLAAAELGIDPTNAVAIEDSLNGVRSAKAAGMWCVAVPSLYNAQHDFSQADVVVAEFDCTPSHPELRPLLKNPHFENLVFVP